MGAKKECTGCIYLKGHFMKNEVGTTIKKPKSVKFKIEIILTKQ